MQHNTPSGRSPYIELWSLFIPCFFSSSPSCMFSLTNVWHNKMDIWKSVYIHSEALQLFHNRRGDTNKKKPTRKSYRACLTMLPLPFFLRHDHHRKDLLNTTLSICFVNMGRGDGKKSRNMQWKGLRSNIDKRKSENEIEKWYSHVGCSRVGLTGDGSDVNIGFKTNQGSGEFK